jgi:hypothetical protein
LHKVVRDPSRNFLFNHLGLNEDAKIYPLRAGGMGGTTGGAGGGLASSAFCRLNPLRAGRRLAAAAARAFREAVGQPILYAKYARKV